MVEIGIHVPFSLDGGVNTVTGKKLVEAGADYNFTYTICCVCDMEYRDPVNAPFAYCPYCGNKRGVKSHG